MVYRCCFGNQKLKACFGLIFFWNFWIRFEIFGYFLKFFFWNLCLKIFVGKFDKNFYRFDFQKSSRNFENLLNQCWTPQKCIKTWRFRSEHLYEFLRPWLVTIRRIPYCYHERIKIMIIKVIKQCLNNLSSPNFHFDSKKV